MGGGEERKKEFKEKGKKRITGKILHVNLSSLLNTSTPLNPYPLFFSRHPLLLQKELLLPLGHGIEACLPLRLLSLRFQQRCLGLGSLSFLWMERRGDRKKSESLNIKGKTGRNRISYRAIRGENKIASLPLFHIFSSLIFNFTSFSPFFSSAHFFLQQSALPIGHARPTLLLAVRHCL